MTQAASTDDAILASVAQHGGVRAAASALDIPYSTFRRRVARAKELQAAVAEAPSPVAAPAVQLPPEMLSMLAAMAAALVATQKPLAPVVVPAEPSRELVRGLKARRKERAERKKAEEEERPVAGGTLLPPEHRTVRVPGRAFVLTSAQNNTYVHPRFFAALEVFCKHNGAQLMVSRYAYNKKGWGQPHQVLKDADGLWYAPEIEPFVCDYSAEIADGLIFCGELNISPTAANPLSGFQSYTREASGIIPHAKVALQSMPVLRNDAPRMLYTTGTCTMENYIDRKAGQLARFHHTYGALFVETDSDGIWFARQLVSDQNGDFQDLRVTYSAEGVGTARLKAITWGDWHAQKADPVTVSSCLEGSTCMLDVLEPEEQHHHDLDDFTERNHHNLGKAFFMATTYFTSRDSVEGGFRMSAALLRKAYRPWCPSYVVDANHCNQAFLKWLEDATSAHADPANAEFWHRKNAEVFRAIRLGQKFYPFEDAVREHCPDLDNVSFLKTDESHLICADEAGRGGIECAIHGHLGPNGSKGSPKGYRALGRRANTGHTHSAGIVDGVWTAGASAMDMGYNVGPSSWSVSHILTYTNGKRAIVTMRGGRWRAKPRFRVRAAGVSVAA